MDDKGRIEKDERKREGRKKGERQDGGVKRRRDDIKEGGSD